MAQQLGRPDLNTDPDDVDIRELELLVRDFTDTITDR